MVTIDAVAETDYTLDVSLANLTFGGSVIFVGTELVAFVRNTPKAVPLVDFQNGSPLLERDLDKSNIQSLYNLQEALDLAQEISDDLIATTAALDAHIAAASPHSDHEIASEKGAADGYAPLDGSALVDPDYLGAGAVGSGAKVLYDNQSWAPPPGASGGEANTIVPSGAGVALTKSPSKVGTEMQLKDLVAGAGITLTPGADSIQVISTGGGGAVNSASNLGAGDAEVFSGLVVDDLQFRGLKAGTNITLDDTSDPNVVEITASGGSGDITGATSPAASGVSLQHSTAKSGSDLQFRKVVAGAGIDISSTGTDQVTVTNTGPSEERPTSMTRIEGAMWKKPGYFSIDRRGLRGIPQTDGVVTSIDDATGPRIKCTTGTTAFSIPSGKTGAAGIRTRPIHVQRRWLPNVGFHRVQLAQGDLLNTRAYIGCLSADYVYGLSSLSATHAACFRFDSSATFSTLMYAVCSDGAAGITEVPITGSTPLSEHDYVIEMGASEVRFYIDGVLEATINTTLPDSSTYLSLDVGVAITGGSTERHIAWARTGFNHE